MNAKAVNCSGVATIIRLSASGGLKRSQGSKAESKFDRRLLTIQDTNFASMSPESPFLATQPSHSRLQV